MPDEGREVSDFEQLANELRSNIKMVAADVKATIETVKRGSHLSSAESGRRQGEIEDRGEMIADLTIAYRHLEDASMRIGKAIQAHDGGASVYDRATTVGA